MSNDESNPTENKDKAEDVAVDIYSDVLCDQDEIVNKLKQRIEELLCDKILLTKGLKSAQNTCEKLKKDYEELQSKYNNLSLNTSALYKTAQAEIARKDKTIQELRRDYDNMVFRKTPGNYSKRQTRPSSRNKSPTKQIESVDNEPLSSKDTCNSSKKLNEATDTQGKEDNNSTKQQESKPKEECKNNGEQSSFNSSNVNTPPPIQGPVTTYSRRLYKKLHGISPEKVISECKESLRGNKAPKELINDKSHSVQNGLKCNRVASKLQDEVKELIKLGVDKNNKTSPPSIKTKEELIVSNNDKTPSVPSPKPTTSSNLIIKCDFRGNKNSSNNAKSPSCVSIYETIDDIIKRHRGGNSVESNKCPEALSKSSNTKTNSGQLKESTGINKTEACVTHLESKSTVPLDKSRNSTGNVPKRSKPLISPATFGKLVPIEKHKANETISLKQRPRKLSDSEIKVPQLSKRSIFSPEKENFMKQRAKFHGNWKRTCLELFGESPIKPKDCSTNMDKSLKPAVSPVPPMNCSSPILPSSPSLGSDDSEDLVIDTTVCSQTSHVSECEQKGKEELLHKSQKTLKVESISRPVSEVQSDKNINNMLLTVEPKDAPNSNNNSDKKVLTTTLKGSNEFQLGNKTFEQVSQNLNADVLKVSKNEEEENPPSFENLDIKGKIFMPDLSECFSLDNDISSLPIKIQSFAPIDSKTVQTAQSEIDSLKINLTHISVETKLRVEEDVEVSDNYSNKDKCDKLVSKRNSSEKDQTSPRFIPSPPQLTLVSAFKHSENSVFTLTEDTVGFVSALTRVRDISPIKTPDKHDKRLNITEQYSNCFTSSDKNVKPLETFKTVTQHSEMLDSEPESDKALLSVDCQTEQHTSKSKNDCGYLKEKTECNGTKRKTVVQNNEFKRERPVRRIKILNSSPGEPFSKLNKENIGSKTLKLPDSVFSKHSSVLESDEYKKNCNESINNTISVKSNSIENSSTVLEGEVLQTPLLQESKESGRSIVSNVDKEDVNISTIKESEILTNNKKNTLKKGPGNIEINKSVNLSPNDKKVFKRSESLKSMPKPIAKVNYDTLSKHQEIKGHYTNSSDEELAQIPHIASINKKIRVSKYQGNNERLRPSAISSKSNNKSRKPQSKSPAKRSKNLSVDQEVRKYSHMSRKRRRSSPECDNKTKVETHNKSLSETIIHKNNSRSKDPGGKSPSPERFKRTKSTSGRKHPDSPFVGQFSRSKSRSPRRRSRSRSKDLSEKSPSPEQFRRTKSTSKRKCSRSCSPEMYKPNFTASRKFHRKYPDSPFVGQLNRSKYKGPQGRSKSSHWKERSRSVSPYWHNRYVRHARSRTRRHHYSGRSRSISPYSPRETKLRSRVSNNDHEHFNKCNSDMQYENKITDETVLVQRDQCYIDELEKLRKELQLVKSIINKSDLEGNTDATTMSKSQNLTQGISSQLDLQDNSSDKKIPLNASLSTPPNKVDENCYKNPLENKPNMTSANKVKELPTVSGESASVNQEPQASAPFKIIKLARRKSRNLGDSDVRVVSSSSKII